jgi:amidohydrolase
VTAVLGYPVTVNNPAMVQRFLPTLRRVAGNDGVIERELGMPAEDFSRYASVAPGFFIGLGVTPPNLDPKTVAVNHSPLFQADDGAIPVGVRAMSNLAVDFLRSGGVPKQ